MCITYGTVEMIIFGELVLGMVLGPVPRMLLVLVSVMVLRTTQGVKLSSREIGDGKSEDSFVGEIM